MNDIEAIYKRCSRRSYLTEKIKDKQIIMDLIDDYNKKSGLNMVFLEDGSSAFNGFMKSYGLFKNVKSIIILKGNTDNIKEKAGYYGEKLVLEATKLKLGTCWVAGTFDKNSEIFSEYKEETIVCLITIGMVMSQKTPREKFVSSVVSRKRKTLEEICEHDETPPSWFLEGVKTASHAPTALNSQKVRFILKDNFISATVPDDYGLDLIDLGICKLHFEIGAGGKFELGNGGKFMHIEGK